jgi:hypothetical protein
LARGERDNAVGAGPAFDPSGDARHALFAREFDPADSNGKERRAVGLDAERVDAAHVGGAGGGRIDDEEAGRCGDERVERAAGEFHLLLVLSRADEADARIGLDGDAADGRDGERGTLVGGGGEPLPLAELRSAGLAVDRGGAGDDLHLPRPAGRAQEENRGRGDRERERAEREDAAE